MNALYRYIRGIGLQVIFILINFNSFANDNKSDSILCSSVYFLASAAYGENQQAAEMMMGLQRSFELIYTANQNRRVSNGEISKLKHQHLMYLAKLFDQNPKDVIKIEMQCNAWREVVGVKLVSFFQSGMSESEIMQAVRKLPKIQKKDYTSDHPRWNNSKTLMYLSFEKWDAMDRMTPYQFQENLKKDLKK